MWRMSPAACLVVSLFRVSQLWLPAIRRNVCEKSGLRIRIRFVFLEAGSGSALKSKLRSFRYSSGRPINQKWEIADSHDFDEKQDPDPHMSDKLDPDPHESKKLDPDQH